jgi:predicted PurR-regulated permease PerM
VPSGVADPPDIRAESRVSGPWCYVDPSPRPEEHAVPRREQILTGPPSPTARVPGVLVLVVLATLYTIYFARAFLLPITFAFLLASLLTPIIRALAKLHVPAPAGAALIMLLFVGMVGVAGYGLAGPVEGWVAHSPEIVRKAGVRLRILTKPVDQVTKAAEQVERVAAAETPGKTREVAIQGPTLASRFFGTTQTVLENAIEVTLLLYFLLAAGDMLLEKLVKVLPQVSDKRKAVRIARAIESSISTYLMTTAMINIGEGAIVALSLFVLGMPMPVVWGAVIACLEFIPYIGMVVGVALLTVTGLTVFPDWPHALAAPGIFIAINFVQGNLVSPLVMSKRLTLNPVGLFIGLAFWWWVWGIAGVLLAVPLMAAFKIVCDHVESLAAVGEFLGGRDPDERRRWLRIRAKGAAGVPQVSSEAGVP